MALKALTVLSVRLGHQKHRADRLLAIVGPTVAAIADDRHALGHPGSSEPTEPTRNHRPPAPWRRSGSRNVTSPTASGTMPTTAPMTTAAARTKKRTPADWPRGSWRTTPAIGGTLSHGERRFRWEDGWAREERPANSHAPAGGLQSGSQWPGLDSDDLKLSHPCAHSVKHFRLGPRPTCPATKAPAAAWCPPPPNVLAKRVAVDLGRATAEADFESAAGLLDKDHRHFDPDDGQRQIHDVFGVGGQGAGGVEILAQRRGEGQPAAEIGLRCGPESARAIAIAPAIPARRDRYRSAAAPRRRRPAPRRPRIVSPLTETKRNQPVSVAMAANSGWANSGVSLTRKCLAASSTRRPVASALVSLNSSAPRSSLSM